MLALLCAASLLFSCGKKKPANPEVTLAPAKLELMADPADMIREMYEARLFEDYDYLCNHCSEHLLGMLKEAYEQETGEEGLAVWLFRSGINGGKTEKHAIISVEPLEDGWWRYEAVDMGVEFTRSIRLADNNGQLLFDDLK